MWRTISSFSWLALGKRLVEKKGSQNQKPTIEEINQPLDDILLKEKGGHLALVGGAGDQAGHDQAELVKARERGQVGAREGSVGHVEVFPVGCVRTPIIGRPRPLPRNRRAHSPYTLICEEPCW